METNSSCLPAGDNTAVFPNGDRSSQCAQCCCARAPASGVKLRGGVYCFLSVLTPRPSVQFSRLSTLENACLNHQFRFPLTLKRSRLGPASVRRLDRSPSRSFVVPVAVGTARGLVLMRSLAGTQHMLAWTHGLDRAVSRGSLRSDWPTDQPWARIPRSPQYQPRVGRRADFDRSSNCASRFLAQTNGKLHWIPPRWF